MRVIHLAIFLLPMPVVAGELPANDLVRAMLQDGRAPVATETFLGNPFSVGPVTIEIGASPIAETSETLGAAIVDEGKGNWVWSCVTGGGQAIWLVSAATDRAGEPLITSVVHTAAPGDEPRCVPMDGLGIDVPVPGLGATLAEIEAAIGSEGDTGNDIIAYRTQDTLGDDGGSWLKIATVGYHMTGGMADAVTYDVVVVN